MLNTKIVTNLDGTFVVLTNDTLGKHLIRGERWEEHFTNFVQQILLPGDVAVDVGANIGYNTVVLAKVVGETGSVIAFEPLRITFQQLCANVILNGLKNVHTYNYALGSLNNAPVSMLPINYHEDDVHIMNAGLGKGGDLVQMMSLDSFKLQRVNLLKIDVQGAEPLVMQGAVETIKSCRPILFIEVEEPQLARFGKTAEELLQDVMVLSYDLFWNPNHGLYDWIGIPQENKNLIEKTQKILGSDYKYFPCPK